MIVHRTAVRRVPPGIVSSFLGRPRRLTSVHLPVNSPLSVAITACPREWEKLQPTNHEDVRRCPQCDRDVHFCTSDADTIAKARAGLCVARLEPHPESIPVMQVVVGQPEVSEVPQPTPEDAAVRSSHSREKRIAKALARMEYETRDCARCGFPVPTFRKTCYVCAAPSDSTSENPVP